MEESNQTNGFNLKSTIAFIVKYKYVLIITFFASAIVIALLSKLLPDYYKSQVLIMPAENSAISKSVLSNMDNYDNLSYGKEKEAEHLLDILNSNTIVLRTLDKFKMAAHYGIDASTKKGSDKLEKRLISNIKIKRTDNLGVKITVWDIDPQYAADIANYMAEQSQILRMQVKQAKMDSLYNDLSRSRAKIYSDLKIMTDSLSYLCAKYKMFEIDKMSDRMSQELAKQIAVGNAAAVARLNKKLEEIGQYGTQIYVLKDEIINKNQSLKMWDEKLEQVRVDTQSNVPTDFIIDNALPAPWKDKPKRSIIALVGGLCCTFIAVFVLILRDKSKDEAIGEKEA
jgi:Uncharacterized protein involved in exopolysaccharide biosynthesis